MIVKLLVTLTVLTALLASLYVEVDRRNHGVLDKVTPQQLPAIKSAKTIRDYRQ
jgi:hypothetical protein